MCPSQTQNHWVITFLQYKHDTCEKHVMFHKTSEYLLVKFNSSTKNHTKK